MHLSSVCPPGWLSPVLAAAYLPVVLDLAGSPLRVPAPVAPAVLRAPSSQMFVTATAVPFHLIDSISLRAFCRSVRTVSSALADIAISPHLTDHRFWSHAQRLAAPLDARWWSTSIRPPCHAAFRQCAVCASWAIRQRGFSCILPIMPSASALLAVQLPTRGSGRLPDCSAARTVLCHCAIPLQTTPYRGLPGVELERYVVSAAK